MRAGLTDNEALAVGRTLRTVSEREDFLDELTRLFTALGIHPDVIQRWFRGGRL